MERQKVQVHMLPTENASNILINKENTLVITNNSYTSSNPQHLYFTSDEKIKEGDYVIQTNFEKTHSSVIKIENEMQEKFANDKNGSFIKRKIVATTDKSLHLKPKLRVGSILTSEKLPQIPQSFIKQYVEADGKIDEVELERERVDTLPRAMDGSSWGKLVIKTDSNNCVIVHSSVDCIIRKELIKHLESNHIEASENRVRVIMDFIKSKNWIKENL